MSTLAYAALTARRERSPQGESREKSPPGVGTYVDVLAALVPAEVLALHAVILSVTTTTTGTATAITAPETLKWAFWGLLVLSVVFYVVPKIRSTGLNRVDWLRALLPPFAFMGWTMLQRATAFDAVFPQLAEAPRTVGGLFLAAVLGLVAAGSAKKADQKPPPNQPGETRSN